MTLKKQLLSLAIITGLGFAPLQADNSPKELPTLASKALAVGFAKAYVDAQCQPPCAIAQEVLSGANNSALEGFVTTSSAFLIVASLAKGIMQGDYTLVPATCITTLVALIAKKANDAHTSEWFQFARNESYGLGSIYAMLTACGVCIASNS